MVRLIRGADCYWVIGQRRVARLPHSAVTPGGQLTAEAARRIEGANLSPAIDPDRYHMTVLITTRCNLACSYCFQNTAIHHELPTRIPGAALDRDMATRALEFCRRRMLERGASRLDIMLFGGEPTLHLDLCLALLTGAAPLGLASAAMVSNATLLKPAAARLLEQAGLRSVQVTLDGDAPVHDRIRITPGGRGTFEQILENVEEAAAMTRLRWLLRVNLSGRSIGTVDTLLDRLAGRLDPSSFDIGFAYVNDSGAGFTDVLNPSPELARRVSGFYRRALDAGFGVAPPLLKQCPACDAMGGVTGAVVNADGLLYSCWESAGKTGYEVGTVDDGYLDDSVIRPRWVSCGYEAKNGPGTPEFDAYRDAVDAAILDMLYTAGRLERTPVPVATTPP